VNTAVSAKLPKLGIQITIFSQFTMSLVLDGTRVITFKNYINVYLSPTN